MASQQAIWYCPSRWLLAHHDKQANINSFASHMCLVDLNDDGDNLLTLIDFKRRDHGELDEAGKELSPYGCRLKIYRGQQLICSHFLDDIPSCLLATSVRTSLSGGGRSTPDGLREQPMLTFALNDDLYFYQKLKPSHKFSMNDDDRIMATINGSELEAWNMVRQNKVDVDTLNDLLAGLADELGSEQLTSHSRNFLALRGHQERKNFLLSWKLKRLGNGSGEHLMSSDTICCAAARLRFTSSVSQSGDYASMVQLPSQLNNARYNRIIDIQRDGIVLGTEDRHLLIYELRLSRTQLESNYRLPAVPDHILVERRSPESFDPKSDLRQLTYKILVACRNGRIYALDQHYLPDRERPNKVGELLRLGSKVVEMSWSSHGNLGLGEPRFIVACTDRRVYCFSSVGGDCFWVIRAEEHITSLTSVPVSHIEATESNLVAVASRANRVDFYLARNGRIVDSIYFSAGDFCQAMKFGRFGREDNCLCLVTEAGSLVILILKRTAKFGHGQCLSSAASFAADVFVKSESGRQVRDQPVKLGLDDQAPMPSSFSIARSARLRTTEQRSDMRLPEEHECDQVSSKDELAAQLMRQQLQVPQKKRDFVRQVVEQSRHCTGKLWNSIQALP